MPDTRVHWLAMSSAACFALGGRMLARTLHGAQRKPDKSVKPAAPLLAVDTVAHSQAKAALLADQATCPEAEEAEVAALAHPGQGPSEPRMPDEALHSILLRMHSSSRSPALWLEGEKEPVSYQTLLLAAKQIAGLLAEVQWSSDFLEAGKPRVVPMLLQTQDGFEVVAGALGVMMSGAAFSALDIVAHPADRIRYMLQTTEAPVALTSAAASSLLQPFQDLSLSIITMTTLAQARSLSAADVREPPDVESTKPMALYWTSGSTGRPKGVLISSKAALTHYIYYLPQFGIGSGKTALRTTAISFDVTFSVVFGTLLHGGAVCWPRTQVLRDPDAMVDVCEKYKVNFLCTVPTSLSVFLELANFPKSVEHVGCAGEALHWSLVDKLGSSTHVPMLHNRYGPTECGNISTLNTNVALAPRLDPTVPVGKPCAHRQLHLVDWEDGNKGEGELWISGPGLSFGYLGQPELTDAAFQALPVQAKGPAVKPGCRAYKTGDVVRWNQNKELVFCGRVDHQVKIRGNRVELGEIEAVFKNIEGKPVSECVVIAEGQGQAMRLIAFVSPKTVDVAAVAKVAAVQLPSYMMPSRILAIDEWPRGSTGKVDRKALAALAEDASASPKEGCGDAIALEQDSLGQMRMRRGKLDPREVTLLANMRFVFCLGLLHEHLMADGAVYLPPAGTPWTAGDWFAGLMTAPLRTFDHTTVFMLLVGFQDSLDVKPFVWNTRDTIVLLYGLFFRFAILEGSSWWSWPFVWVRLLAILGNRVGGRVGRLVVYGCWLAFCAWVRETQCPSPTNSWLFSLPIPGWSPVSGYMVGATLGNFEVMFWLGLELGPNLRSLLQRHDYFSKQKGKPLLAACFLAMFVLLPWVFPKMLDPAAHSLCPAEAFQTRKDLLAPLLNALTALVTLAGFLILAVPAGLHLPPTWALSSVLISYPFWSLPGPVDPSNPFAHSLVLFPKFMLLWPIQIHTKMVTEPMGWLWAIALILLIFTLLIAYYVTVGVLTHEICGLLAKCWRFCRRCACPRMRR